MSQAPLDRVRFVLVETSHTGNLGAVARAMKTMGLHQLHLVRPKQPPDAQAIARAAGADDLLAAARIHENLTQALAGCRLVIGSSARRRTLDWPLLEPSDCAQMLMKEAQAGEVALVFGRESTGLTNRELQSCQYLAWIPTAPDFRSLNLAAAAQVFAYEIRRAASQCLPPAPSHVPAPAEQVAGLHAHLMNTLITIGFVHPQQSKTLAGRLYRFLHRARPDPTEINILRGILRAVARLQKEKDLS